jgi:hypothetical protein
MQGAWDTGEWDDALWDSLPVTGNAATGEPGNTGATTTVSITGVSATGYPGDAPPEIVVALSGNSAVGQVGTISYASEIAVSGVPATGAVGDLVLSVTAAISGESATGETGSVTVVTIPVVLIDGHDGKPFKRQIAKERKRNEARRQSIIDAYERVVEGRPEIAQEIVAPFIVEQKIAGAPIQVVNFDALLDATDRAQRLLDAYMDMLSDMDDEEVLALL